MAKHLVWLALMAAIVSAALIQSAPVKARWDRVGAEIPLERITNMWAPDENEIYFAGIPSLYRYDVNGWSPVEIDGQRLVVNDLWGGSATSWFGIDADNGGIIWRDGPDWHSYGLGPEHELYTIWGSGPNDIYVGGYSAMLHYDGRDWSRVNEIGYRSVLSISGNSPDNVYALCGRYQIYHFDGTSWRQVWLSGLWLDALWTAPTGETIAVGSDGCILRGQGDTWTQQDSGVSKWLGAVWGTAADDIFVGGEYEGIIVHYDGTAWSRMGYGFGTGSGINGFWGTGPANVYAATSWDGLKHYDGSVWTYIELPSMDGADAVWGAAPDDIYALNAYTYSSDYQPRIVHYDGTAWALSYTGVTGQMFSLWGASADDIYTVGQHGVIVHYDGTDWSMLLNGGRFKVIDGSSEENVFAAGTHGKVARFDGERWELFTFPSGDRILDLSVYGPNCALATTGDSVYHSTRNHVYRFDGTDWEDLFPLASASVTALWGIGPDHVIGVGTGIDRWDGMRWEKMLPPHATGYSSVWGAAWNSIFAVGPGGAVARYDGVQWTAMASGTVADLLRVYGTSANDVFAAGEDGTLLHFDGAQWRTWAGPQPDGVGLTDVWVGPNNQILAVGDQGTAVRYDGTSWSLQDTGTELWLGAVWGFPSGEAYAAGDDGAVFYYDGTQWWTHDVLGQVIRGLWGADPGVVFAVGEGIIARYDQGARSYVIRDPSLELNDVWGTSAENVFAVGESGLILRSNGFAWSKMDSGTDDELTALCGWSGDNILALSGLGTILRFDGSSWQPSAAELPALSSSGYISLWGASAHDVYVAGRGGILYHLDGQGDAELLPLTYYMLDAINGWQDLAVVVGDSGVILVQDLALDRTGVDLQLNRRIFHGGDRLELAAACFNDSSASLTADLYIALDPGTGDYYFWPGWAPYPAALPSTPISLASGGRATVPVLDFIWPCNGLGLLPDLCFWGALIGHDGRLSGRISQARFAFH